MVAKKEQKFNSGIQDELSIFNKGVAYWQDMITRGQAQEVLTPVDVKALQNAINYCNLVYSELKSYQVKEIVNVVKKLQENGIE